MYSIYSNNKDALKHLLKTPGVIDTDAFTLLAGRDIKFILCSYKSDLKLALVEFTGVDIRHLAAVQEFADERGIPWKVQCVMNVLMLEDTCHLCLKERYSDLKGYFTHE